MDDSKAKHLGGLGVQTHTEMLSVVGIRIIFLERPLDNKILKKKKNVGDDQNATMCTQVPKGWATDGTLSYL